MPKHVLRLVSILVVVLVLAVGGAHYVTDSSFYRFGHFRADVVPELAAGTPQFQGSDSCQACHDQIYSDWNEGIHVVVQCEVCHGAGARHPDDKKLTVPPDTVRLCSLCHEAMPARPKSQPQIVINEHPYKHEQPLASTTCQDAHTPSLASSTGQTAIAASSTEQGTGPESPPVQSASSARPIQQTLVLVPQCASCHGAAGEGVGNFPALAGRESAYLATQMQRYRSGELSGPMMSGIVASMTDKQILELADYYADLPKPELGNE